MTATRTKRGVRSARTQSIVTNGKRLHVVATGNTPWARRFRDVYDQICADLGTEDELSEAQKQIVRRCSLIAIACEKVECEAALGKVLDVATLDSYGRNASRLGRELQRLGLKRVARDITPTVKAYAARGRDQQTP